MNFRESSHLWELLQQIGKNATPTCHALMAIIALVSAVSAQSITGTILGTVTDESGAIVPGVSIRATHNGTNLSRAVASDQNGYYELPLLPVGRYTITAESTGFKTVERVDVELQLEQRLSVNITLPVGNLSEKITVTDSLPVVEAFSTERGMVIDNKRIVELPLNGRDFTDLMRLAPGVIDRNYVGLNINGGRGASTFPRYTVATSRPANNRWLLDGSNNMNHADGTVIVKPSIDALQEFNIKTDQYSAEYGGGGAIINATVKSGTNALHGSAFEFLRNDKLNAREFFAPQRNPFRYNQFGGVISGPVFIPKLYDGRNRSFFLFNYEGVRRRDPSDNFLRVPTAAERQGDFSELSFQLYDPTSTGANNLRLPFANSLIPKARWSPYAANVLGLYPEGNMPLNNRNQNFFASTAAITDANQYHVRGDHAFTENWTTFSRYSVANQIQASPQVFFGAGGTDTQTRNKNLTVGLTGVLSPTLIAEFRAGYSRYEVNSGGILRGVNVDKQVGFPFADRLEPVEQGLSGMVITNMTGLGSGGETQSGPSRTLDLSASITKVSGKHTIKAGLSFQRFDNDSFSVQNRSYQFTGLFTGLVSDSRFVTQGYGLADFLLGYPGQLNFQPALPGIGRVPTQLLYKSTNGFVWDQWNVHPRLTINWGLRYEFNSPPIEKNNRTKVSNITPEGIVYYPAALDIDDALLPPTFAEPGIGDAGQIIPAGSYIGRLNTRTIWDADRNNFQPRVGLAFRPFGTERTVLRASGGIFNSRPTAHGAAGAPFFSRTEQREDQTLAPQYLRLGELPDALWTPAGVFSFNMVPRDNPDAFITMWGFNIQQELRPNLKLEIAYLGNRASRLSRLMFYNIRRVPGAEQNNPCGANCPTSRPFPRPFPQFGEDRTFSPIGWSNYHGLQVNLQRRFSDGLTFQTSFNWNKGLDGGVSTSGDFVTGEQPDGQPENLFNLANEKGRSGDSPLKRFVASWVYELPFGNNKKLLSDGNPVVKGIISDWEVAGMVTMQSGFPFSIFVAGDISGTGTGRLRANRVADGRLPNDQKTLDRWFDTAAFQIPDLNTFGTAGRRILDGPGLNTVDLNVSRKFRIKENQYLQFRAEFFNLANRPIFNTPRIIVNQANYGKIISTIGPPRQIQFALKYVF